MTIAKTLKVGGMAVAMLGFSACDPAPPPLDCTTLDKGQSLTVVDASLSGQTLTVTLSNDTEGTWTGTPTILNATGATAGSVDILPDGSLSIVLTVASGAMSGTFTLSALVQGFGGPACQVERVFHFTIDSGNVTVAERDPLPLGAKERATIVVMRRDGREVDLSAAGASGGAVGWTATGGAVSAHAADRVTWRLPEEPGLYQMELLVDRGREGISVDTVTIEVG